MDKKKVAGQLLKLAKALVGVGGYGQSMPDEIVPGENPNIQDEHKAALEMMEKDLERIDKGVRTIFFKKGRALAFNIGMTGGGSFMGFSVLPTFWKRFSYYPKQRVLNIEPNWHISQKSYRSYQIPVIADKIVKGIKTSRTLKEVVLSDLDAVEKEFGISIPNKTKAAIVKYAERLQKSRLTARRVKPKEFFIEE